jgi:hypothetical protein
LSTQFSIPAKFRPGNTLKIQRKKMKLVFTHVKWSHCQLSSIKRVLEKEVKGDSFKIALYKCVQTDFGCTMSPNALYTMPSTLKSHKNSRKDQWPKPSQGSPKGKAKRRTACKNQKRERASPCCGKVSSFELNLGLNPKTLQHITVYKSFCHYFWI